MNECEKNESVQDAEGKIAEVRVTKPAHWTEATGRSSS